MGSDKGDRSPDTSASASKGGGVDPVTSTFTGILQDAVDHSLGGVDRSE